MEENLDSSSKGSGYQESTAKRSKTHHQDEQESGPDRLSELPEPLLVQILSFLEMKDAVKTGILSKMWKHLWTHVDKIVLEFDVRRQSSEKLPEFISFVHHTLMQCTCPNLKKFSLFAFHDNFDTKLLDEWLQWVFKKNLEFLNLDIIVDDYCFPKWFYHNSSLVKLDINMNNPDWDLGQEVSWTSLKSLHLSNVLIGDEQIANLLSGCPVLETIVLFEPVSISYLNIMWPSVRTLKLINLDDFGFSDWLEIDAPCLKELEIAGSYFNPRCRLVDVSSLEYAKFDYTPESTFVDCNVVWPEVAAELLESVNHVKELILGPVFIQTLSLLKLLGTPFPLFKCKHVTIHSPLLEHELPGIACLLDSSPYLDTLIIEVVTPGENYFHGYYGEILYSNGDKYLGFERGNLSNLKNIKVAHCRNMCSEDAIQTSDSKCFDLELVIYVLKNAHALEKLVITSTVDDFCKCSRNCGSQYASLLSDRIICMCLDGNEVYEWELRKNKSYFEFRFRKFCDKTTNSL
ncbi:hypothetical protein Pfo_019032 [Paulownia fortunei]|nr:hypothetical protein Pfo_019032 [Paulownia fortunei]